MFGTALTPRLPGNLDLARESYETLLSTTSAEGAAGNREQAAKDLGEGKVQIAQVSVAMLRQV